ncbi:MAG: carbohydrate ABC transporter permease [Candidatus Bipolaricaulia bacterium]
MAEVLRRERIQVVRVVKKRRLPPQAILFRAFLYFIIIFLGFTMLLPFVWMTSTAFKPADQVLLYPPTFIPRPFTLDNFYKVFSSVPLVRYYMNSIIIAVSVTLFNLFFDSLAGYAFAKFRFPGRNKIFILILATMMIPFQVTLIPVFWELKWLGWLNTYQGLIVPHAAGAFGIFLMRQYIKQTLPTELMDAARIDGSSELGIYFRVVLPNIKPALATLGIFTFMGTWTDVLWPLIVSTNDKMFTLPLGLANFSDRYTIFYGQQMAMTFLIVVPIIIVFLFFQRYFIEGITLSGLGGH